MTDPVAELIWREQEARDQMVLHESERANWSKTRRRILNRLHGELGTWQKVADATGQKLPTVHKAASQPRKKQQ